MCLTCDQVAVCIRVKVVSFSLLESLDGPFFLQLSLSEGKFVLVKPFYQSGLVRFQENL